MRAIPCPSCGFENLIGAEICDNCGADIFGVDVPQQAPAFHGQLLGEHLNRLGAPPPLTVAFCGSKLTVLPLPFTNSTGVGVLLKEILVPLELNTSKLMV